MLIFSAIIHPCAILELVHLTRGIWLSDLNRNFKFDYMNKLSIKKNLAYYKWHKLFEVV